MELSKMNKYFMGLPDEMWLEVFSFFTPIQLCRTIAPVCKDFWRLSKDGTLWPKELSFRITSDQSIPTSSGLLRKCLMLGSLKVDSTIPLDYFIDYSISLPLLKKLDLGFCEWLNVSFLQTLVGNCPRIEDLNLEGCNVDFTGVCHIVTLTNLKLLNLCHCENIDDMCMEIIAKNCHKLQLLNVDEVSTITDTGVHELCEYRHGTLLHLFLDGERLTDQSMVSISACKKLLTLKLSCGDLLTDSSLTALSKLPNLTFFKLCFNKKITKEAWQQFFFTQSLSRLKCLKLRNLNIDDTGLQNLSITCKNLNILALAFCYEITDLGLKPVIENCTSLTSLDLKGLNKLTGTFLIQIPSCLVNLADLDLIQCNNICTDSVEELTMKMPSLKVYDCNGAVIQTGRKNSDSESE